MRSALANALSRIYAGVAAGQGWLSQQSGGAGSVALLASGWRAPEPAVARAAQPARGMAGRTHRLSLKKPNNRASWLAVQPFLQQPQQQPGGEAPAQPKREPIATAIPPLPVQPEPSQQRLIGRITGPYAVRPQAAFAVVESGGVQWKVTADDLLYHNKIPGAQVNDVLELGKVLLLGTAADTTVGRPFIPGASVVAAVEEVFKDTKVQVFKKKKRKGWSKLRGHRSHITALRILELRGPDGRALPVDAAALDDSTQQGQQQEQQLQQQQPAPIAPAKSGRLGRSHLQRKQLAAISAAVSNIAGLAAAEVARAPGVQQRQRGSAGSAAESALGAHEATRADA